MPGITDLPGIMTAMVQDVDRYEAQQMKIVHRASGYCLSMIFSRKTATHFSGSCSADKKKQQDDEAHVFFLLPTALHVRALRATVASACGHLSVLHVSSATRCFRTPTRSGRSSSGNGSSITAPCRTRTSIPSRGPGRILDFNVVAVAGAVRVLHAQWSWAGPVILTAMGCRALGRDLRLSARRADRGTARSAVAMLALLLSLHHVLARPHILALPVMVAWVGLLMQRPTGERAVLVLAAADGAVANLHGGFVLGLALIGPISLEAVERPRKDGG